MGWIYAIALWVAFAAAFGFAIFNAPQPNCAALGTITNIEASNAFSGAIFVLTLDNSTKISLQAQQFDPSGPMQTGRRLIQCDYSDISPHYKLE